MASRPLYLAVTVAGIYKHEFWLKPEGRTGDHGGHRGRENRAAEARDPVRGAEGPRPTSSASAQADTQSAA